MNVAQETLDFRWTRFSLVLSLLMPTSSLSFTPVWLAPRLLMHCCTTMSTMVANEMLLYQIRLATEVHSFGNKF